MILLRNISFTRCENMYPASLPALSDLLITSASSPDSGVYAGIRDGGFRVSKKISFFRNDVCLLPQKSFFFHPQKFPMTFLLLVIDSNLRNSTLFHYFFFHKCVYYFTSSLIIPLFIILNEFLFALYLPKIKKYFKKFFSLTQWGVLSSQTPLAYTTVPRPGLHWSKPLPVWAFLFGITSTSNSLGCHNLAIVIVTLFLSSSQIIFTSLGLKS